MSKSYDNNNVQQELALVLAAEKQGYTDKQLKEVMLIRCRGETRAVKLMWFLMESNDAAFVMLQDPDICNWWNMNLSATKDVMIRALVEWKKYYYRIEAYHILTSQERKALKFRKPVPPKNLPQWWLND